MKTLILLVAVVIISHTAVFSQGCLPEGITFETQEQIDNFQTNYPGCTEILGDVVIYDYNWGDMTNLNGLSVLTSIGGDLSIYTIPGLTNLFGLENLTTIGGSFEIGYLDSIIDFTGLEQLNYIGNDFSISGIPLASLNGLEELTYIGGEFYLNGLTLTDLSGLNNLQLIGGDFDISYNPLLTSFLGLNSLISIGNDLNIYGNTDLTSLNGLENLQANSIHNISIYDNISLTYCAVQSICEYLSSPYGIINIHSNSTGCNNVSEIASNCGISLPCLPYGNYYFLTQADVDNFHLNYPECEDLNGNISIFGNNITNLLGLTQITSVSGSVYILGENPNMSNLEGLNNLLLIGEGLSIYSNSALTSLMGLNSLYSIGGNLKIVNNDSLNNLMGLDTLTTIGGYISIYGNEIMSVLIGLQELTTINGDIQVMYNPSLTSLFGLDNIEAGTISSLRITYNILLSDCDIKSVCEYMVNPNGYIQIYTNSEGCNSPEEVEQHCLTLMEENPIDDELTVFPNPASSFITLTAPGDLPIEEVIIYNRLGQKVLTARPVNNVLDVSGLKAGMYMIEVRTKEFTGRQKLIKQ